MKRLIVTYNQIEGFHRYPDAPDFCAYLKERHRHLFVIRCSFIVTHNEREIEINQRQRDIESFLQTNYGKPCEFGGMSCESIAEILLMEFPCIDSVTVLEDGYGGATLSR